MKYQLFKNAQGEVKSVLKTDNNGVIFGIPFDPNNTDYQAFLKYQAEGGVVLPADSSTEGATSLVTPKQEVTV
jgi:hypothetical protein